MPDGSAYFARKMFALKGMSPPKYQNDMYILYIT